MDYQTAQELCDALSAPFPTEYIEWRVGSATKDKEKGMALAYIDARTVADRLDTACGLDGWQCNYTQAGSLMLCNLGVKMPDGSWVWKTDGAGATDFEGEKGMLSDAFKRAAVRFGVGRYLYGIDTPWVPLEGEGRRIAPSAKRTLDEEHEKIARRVGWGNPGEVAVYKLLLHAVKQYVTQPGDVIEFRENNKGLIPQLRVAMRNHFDQELDRIGGAQREAAE